MKWKRSKKATSEAKAKVSPASDKNKSSEHSQSKPEDASTLNSSASQPFIPTINKETNNNAQFDAVSMVTSTKTLANENLDPTENQLALSQSELSNSFSAEEEDSIDADSRIINVTAWVE